ncbi:uncharacterized protein LOC128990144 [Macrosteles quadrilineatus]|uniref:uncharacterized protein LOC128990144 n=1 Tax=Macrosteles quadrilineatus TaxID=74068 RepID=UPI0023E1C516|nr:uncharacterized protein LOC128990144 [Macrosteles quadrilineatus]
MGLDRDTATILDAIAALRKDTNESFIGLRKESSEMWQQTQNKLDKVECDINILTTGLGEVKLQYDEVKSKITATDINVEKIQEENIELQTKILDMQTEIEEMQQYSRIDNIVITGVPMLKGENVFMILADIAKVLNINFHRYDVSAAHRLSNKMSKGRPPVIVVKFSSRTIKSEWLDARKEKGSLKANEIHRIFPDSTVYFNEHLTEHSRKVFNLGRDMVKEKCLAYVWVKDGRILVKQTEQGKTIRVKTENDLKRIRRSSSGPAALKDEVSEAAAPGNATTPVVNSDAPSFTPGDVDSAASAAVPGNAAAPEVNPAVPTNSTSFTPGDVDSAASTAAPTVTTPPTNTYAKTLASPAKPGVPSK